MRTVMRIVICVALLYACLCVVALIPPGSIPVQELTQKDSKFIQVDGRTLHYTQNGSGSPIVLVHGFAGSSYTWRNVIPLLAEKNTVYALDLPGFGLSDKSPDADYTLRSQARIVNGFMNALHLQSVALAGHSMGGVVVSIAAIEAPRLISKLVIIDAGFYHGGAPKIFQKLFFPFDVLVSRLFYTKFGRTKSLAYSYYDKSLINDDLIANYLRPAQTPHAIDALVKMMRTASRESYEGISARVSVPTLLIWARNDNPIPLSDAERLHREIQGSHLVVIDDAGHMVQEEKPKEVAEAIRKFIQ